MTPKDFIAAIAPAAHAVFVANPQILASITIAQAAIESGWGQDAPGYNLFGIKADPAWTGAFTTQPTHEYVNGRYVAITARFRAYPGYQASLEDHAAFLLQNPRYAPALAAASQGAQAYAQQLQACGYSTNPQYAHLLMEIVNTHDLTSYDVVVASA